MAFDGRIEALMTIPTGGATMSVTNTGGGPTTVTIPAGSYYLTAAGGVTGLLATVKAQLDATRPPASGSWTVALSTGASGTLRITITCTGSWDIEWTGAQGPNLGEILGWEGDVTGVSGAVTSDNQARGVWGPDCPLWMNGHPRMAPKKTDRRDQVSPTGNVIAIVGNKRYVHRGLRYSHVPLARYREGSATYENASWERFLDDTQWGENHTWFTPGSKCQIYDHTGSAVGSDYASGTGVSGWYLVGLDAIQTDQSEQGYTGLFRVEIPEISTSG